MNSSLFKKSQFKLLCSIIGFKTGDVEYIIENIDSYYNEWFEKKIDEKTGELKKFKDGTIKERTIRPSLRELKLIHNRIKDRILEPIELPQCIHGGVKKKSNITNAKSHQGKKYQFTTDLKDFFPSIKYEKIYKTFLKLKFSNHYSYWLAKLTTWKNELPQGTPTSTHIANLVFLETDYKLISFCKRNDIIYTRFVDDLTFSSQKNFKHLLNEILEIIKSSDFKISHRKTKYRANQTITGIEVFLNKIDAPERIKQKVELEKSANTDKKPYSAYLKNIQKTNKKKNPK